MKKLLLVLVVLLAIANKTNAQNNYSYEVQYDYIYYGADPEATYSWSLKEVSLNSSSFTPITFFYNGSKLQYFTITTSAPRYCTVNGSFTLTSPRFTIPPTGQVDVLSVNFPGPFKAQIFGQCDIVATVSASLKPPITIGSLAGPHCSTEGLQIQCTGLQNGKSYDIYAKTSGDWAYVTGRSNTDQTINLTYGDIINALPGYIDGQSIYLAASGGNKPNASFNYGIGNIGHITGNESLAFSVYRPFVVSSVSSHAPSCTSGTDGSVTVNFPTGTKASNYTYTLRNLLLRNGGDCSANYASGYVTTPLYGSKYCLGSVATTITVPDNASNSFEIKPEALSGPLKNGFFPSLYDLKIESSKGISCIYEDTVRVSDAPPLVFSSAAPQNSYQSLIDGLYYNITSAAGKDNIAIVASGGTNGYKYTVTNAVGTVVKTGQSNNGTFTISGLSADTYTISLTDGNSCTNLSKNVTLIAPPALSIGGKTATKVTCHANDLVTPESSHNDGTISFTIAGGIGPYTITTSPATLPENISTKDNKFVTISNLKAGKYYISVYKVFVEQVNDTITVASNPAITTSNAPYAPTCYGGNTGNITLPNTSYQAAFESPIGTWNWSANNIIPNLTAGSYNIRIRNSVGCTADSIPLVAVPNPSPLTINATGKNISCFGLTNGQIINVSASNANANGNTNYYYTSSANPTPTPIYYNASEANLPSGSYTVYVKDANDCPLTEFSQKTITIDNPSSLVITLLVPLDISKNGLTDGTVTLTASGNTASYTYNLLNSLNAVVRSGNASAGVPFTIAGLSKGTYSVQVFANATCSITSPSFHIAEPLPLTVSEVGADHVNVKCHGLSTGSFLASGSGGWSPYRYKLGASGSYSVVPVFYNKSAGVYTLYAIDNRGVVCSTTVTITEPLVTLKATSLATNAKCFDGNDGTITVTATGGTSPYSYAVNAPLATINANVISGLIKGDYKVTVTDFNECPFITSSISIFQPTSPLAFKLDSIRSFICGKRFGAIFASVQGGTQGYTYQWKDENGLVVNDSLSPKYLRAGVYTLTLTDAHLCTLVSPPCKVDNEAVVMDALYKPLQLILLDSISPKCNGYLTGSAKFKGINGLKDASYGYDFSLRNIATNAIVLKQGLEAPFSELMAGTYEVVLQDQYKCQLSSNNRDTIKLNEPKPIVINSRFTRVRIKGGNNAVILDTISGGTRNYSYEWYYGSVALKDSLIKKGITIPQLRHTWLSDLKAGSYLLKLQDANGCYNGASGKGWIAKTYTIKEPESLLSFSNLQHTNVKCYGFHTASIMPTASGGWDSSYRYWLKATNLLDTTSFKNLGAGLYTVFVADDADVIFSDTVSITEPRLLTIEADTIINPKCFGDRNGSSLLSVDGGKSPYRISTSNPTALINGNTISGFADGNYSATVTDQNSCTSTIPVTFIQPDTISITSTIVDSECNKAHGAIYVTYSGGTKEYSYNWYYENVLKYHSNSLDGVLGGTYRLEVSDKNGCKKAPISFIIGNTNGPVPNQSTTPVKCWGEANGTATIGVNSGTGETPFTYKWIYASDTIVASNARTGLRTGNYKIIITGKNNCSNSIDAYVNTPPLLTVSTDTMTLPHCYGGSDGSLTAKCAGGNGGYTYIWDSGNYLSTRSGIKAGIYSGTFTDSKGCRVFYSETLPNPAPVVVAIAPKATICVGQTATIDAGSFVSYNWNSTNSFSSDNQVVNLSKKGKYFLTVKDARGCFGQDTVEVITSNLSLNADFIMKPEAFVGDTVVAINITWPKEDAFSWDYDKTITHYASTDYDNLIFHKAGTYTIRMYASLGDCRDVRSQLITITDKAAVKSMDVNPEAPLIQAFSLHPNPNNGNFTAEISLRENCIVTLRLFSNSLLIDNRTVSGLTSFPVEYNVGGLASGIYILQIIAGKEQKMIKMLIYK